MFLESKKTKKQKDKMIRGKKGAGHVEMIISFVIFIGFLIFLFVMFNPFQKPADNSDVDAVYIKLEEAMEVELTSVSVNIKTLTEPTKTCSAIIDSELIDDLNCDTLGVIVKKDGSTKISGNIEGNLINIQGGPGFYTILCAKDLITQSISGCSSADYTIGIINTKKMWAKSELTNFDIATNKFADNYGFVVSDLNKQVLVNKYDSTKVPTGIRVQAKSYPIDV